ncbi:MAG: class I SAM-dependent methyltransferase [Ignavibacteria bacterium]|nr:class I SAM-dependent methyltransferase [Ignavibacteria bacterium]
MRSIDYKKWADFIYSISKELKKKNLLALELACGNGAIANKLNKKFEYLCISDLSLQMISAAKKILTESAVI